MLRQSRQGQLRIETCLVKPVSASALLEAILAALGARTYRDGDAGSTERRSVQPASWGESAMRSIEKPKRTLRVLVADDHEANRALAMKHIGYVLNDIPN